MKVFTFRMSTAALAVISGAVWALSALYFVDIDHGSPSRTLNLGLEAGRAYIDLSKEPSKPGWRIALWTQLPPALFPKPVEVARIGMWRRRTSISVDGWAVTELALVLHLTARLSRNKNRARGFPVSPTAPNTPVPSESV